jgi:hypothetical protein
MLRNVREAKTVAYVVTLLADGKVEGKADVLMAGAGNLRVTWEDGRTQIHNAGAGRWLRLAPASRTAAFTDSEPADLFGSPLAALRRAAESDGESLGAETLGASRVDVYQVKKENWILRVWCDIADELPIRVESTPAGEAGGPTMVLSDFYWDIPVSPSDFALDVPAGYTVRQPEEDASEESLVEALGLCAERAGGAFPATFDKGARGTLLLGAGPREEPALGRASVFPGPSQTDREFYQKIRIALAYVENAEENGSWRYEGGGVRLGDGGRPVCWWRPTESAVFRVVYGDLTVRDVSPEQLEKETGLGNEITQAPTIQTDPDPDPSLD